MHIAIIGAGIAGVTTAYELAESGHAVTVFERHSSVAEEASFANAGLIVPGLVTPWRAPHWTRLLLGRTPHGPRLSWPPSGADLAWLGRLRRATSDTQARAANQQAMQQLAFYSRARLNQVAEQLDYTFDRAEGALILLRTERDRERAQSALDRLLDAGVDCREVDADQARQIEPALHPATPLVSAIHLPDGEAGNCRQFAVIARDAAEQMGVQFIFNTAVAIDPTRPSSLWLAGETGPRAFDAVVLCAGVAAGELLAPLGLRLPIAPVYGYSVSAPVTEPVHAPHATVIDGRIAITRLGQRVRVAGLSEIGGHRASATSMRALPLWAEQRLYRTLTEWFPAAARLNNGVQLWRGARPMLPDGPPVLGGSGLPGLWLNTGHGGYGWSMACGSARIVADLIAGRAPDIDLHGLGVERFR